MRYQAIVEYDGTRYSGFQSQPNEDSIQRQIERALRLMTQKEIRISASGRTDKGVHALGQSIHFDFNTFLDSKTWVESLNKRLPGDIRIKKVVKKGDGFHARFDAKSKIYKYVISKRELNAFENNYMYYNSFFDITLVRECIQDLVGTHDFFGLSKFVEGKNTIKSIFEIKIKETKDSITFLFHGNSFLKYMVRSMMGLIIEIGCKKKTASTIKNILETKNRSLAGKTAPASGLYLVKVFY